MAKPKKTDMRKTKAAKKPKTDLTPKFTTTKKPKGIKRPFASLVKKYKMHPVEAAALRRVLPVDPDGLILEKEFVAGREKWRKA